MRLRGMGAVVTALNPVNDFYFTHRADFLEKVRGILGDIRTITVTERRACASARSNT